MIIDWTLSETLIAKCKKIAILRKQGKTWYDISKELKQTRGYLISLYSEYKKQKGVRG